MLRGIFLALAVAAVGLGLLAGGLYQAANALFYYRPPPVQALVASTDGEKRAEDAAYFSQFPLYDRSYTDEAKAQAADLIAALERDAKSLSQPAFYLRIAEITALADNSHTGLAAVEMRKSVNALPLRFYWFIDGLHVVRARAGHEHLLGARIGQIDGQPIEQLYTNLRKYFGGVDAFRRSRTILLMESPELLQAAGLAQDAGSLTLTGSHADGSPLNMRVEATAASGEIPVPTRHLLFAASEEAEKLGWHSLKARDADGPVSFKGAPHIFKSSALPAHGFYIGLFSNMDMNGEEIAPFIAATRSDIAEKNPDYVVVDLRLNSGGDYTNTYDFATDLPNLVHPKARIYVLTSGWTLSAAITTTGAIKQAGGKRVTIVGEPIAERMRFYAEGDRMCLPHAGACMGYATAMHDYSQFCSDVTRCFWLNYVYPVQVASFDPEIYTFITFEDYRAGRDGALDAVLAREVGTTSAIASSRILR